MAKVDAKRLALVDAEEDPFVSQKRKGGLAEVLGDDLSRGPKRGRTCSVLGDLVADAPGKRSFCVVFNFGTYVGSKDIGSSGLRCLGVLSFLEAAGFVLDCFGTLCVIPLRRGLLSRFEGRWNE